MSTDRALYEKMYAAQLAEGHDLETAMRYNKAATPEDFLRAFGQSSDPRHQHRKWGGGNKMGSGGAAVNAARRARAEAKKSAPDPNVNPYTNRNLADHLGLGRFFSNIDAHVNDRQGKPLAPNPSWGFSQKTLNEAGARGADPSFAGDIGASVYGVSPANSFSDASSFGFSGDLGYGSPVNSFTDSPSFNFTGDLGYSPTFGFTDGLGDASLSSMSSFDPGSFLGAMAMNQGPSTPVRQYDGKFLPYFGGGRNGPIRMKAPIQASDPRFAMSIFA
jgi:hypothetical protein